MAGALADACWQDQNRVRLQRDTGRLAEILHAAKLSVTGGSALFQTVCIRNPRVLADLLAAQGIFVRIFENPGMLRFGLAAQEPQWARLEAVLAINTCD
jgi:cobalamin biosynthetic protein CobC